MEIFVFIGLKKKRHKKKKEIGHICCVERAKRTMVVWSVCRKFNAVNCKMYSYAVVLMVFSFKLYICFRSDVLTKEKD